MQIVINIDDDVYKRALVYKDVQLASNSANDLSELITAVANGTPLPKGHGRLADIDFEENHYASILINPTPDVTEYDKENAKVILKALKMMGTVIKADEEIKNESNR